MCSVNSFAVFHLWNISEIYSNNDGSVQYIELFTQASGQQFVSNQLINSLELSAIVRATFTFPSDSPSGTAGKHLLLATPGFSTVAGVDPDYTIPANFLSLLGGTVQFVGADTLPFGVFPTDSTMAIQAFGTVATATPTNFAGVVGAMPSVEPDVTLFSAILPSSRSVMVGNTATVFASVINAGSSNAFSCTIAPITPVLANFFFQTTDPTTNAPTGTQNAAVDIASNTTQTFFLGFTPTAEFTATDVQLRYGCANADDAAVVVGLNTLLLSASNTPIADIVALSATVNNDGIVHIPGTLGTGFFSIASVNVGSSDTIFVSADTGNAVLPVVLSICETDPVTGACINPTSPTTGSINLVIDANAVPTFAVFVAGSDDVALDPAASRIFVRFEDSGAVARGTTSVAVQTDANSSPEPDPVPPAPNPY